MDLLKKILSSIIFYPIFLLLFIYERGGITAFKELFVDFLRLIIPGVIFTVLQITIIVIIYRFFYGSF